jgi:hypothetical protein
MSFRTISWLAWSLCALSLALTALGFYFLALSGSHPSVPVFDQWLENAVVAVCFSVMGAVITSLYDLKSCEELLISFLRHSHNLADRPPVSTGCCDAEHLFNVRSELGPPYPLRSMEIENALPKSESLAIALDAFKDA